MIELIQGEGGVLPLDTDYVKAIAKMAKERDILLIVDEVPDRKRQNRNALCLRVVWHFS